MSGKRYYPNNWEHFKDAPDEMFEPHLFDEVMEWKVAGWELPSSVCCIIRVRDTKTYKVKEHVYMRESAAQNKVRQLMHTPDIEFTVCNHEAIHHLTCEAIDNDD
jgi:hypothetical protein